MKKIENVSSNRIIIVLFAVLVVIGLVNVLILARASIPPQQQSTAAMLQLAVVDNGCPECSNYSQFVQQLKTQNVNVTEKKVDASSAEGAALVTKYSLAKFPALVITGELNKTVQLASIWPQVGILSGDAVLVEPQLPYYSSAENRVVGLVNVTRISDSSCSNCASIGDIIESLKRYGVSFTTDTSVEYNTPQGQAMVSKFGIKQVPAAIISKDIVEYPAVAQVWPQLNATEKDGYYAVHVLQAPYRDLKEGRVVGLVDVIYLNDSSCSNCYDVTVHRTILRDSFGVVFANQTFVDISSTQGKAIISKFNITKVPTFLMSPEAKYYVGLMQVWPTVGNQTQGWYVFRDMSALGGIYKDLTTNKTVVQAG